MIHPRGKWALLVCRGCRVGVQGPDTGSSLPTGGDGGAVHGGALSSLSREHRSIKQWHLRVILCTCKGFNSSFI